MSAENETKKRQWKGGKNIGGKLGNTEPVRQVPDSRDRGEPRGDKSQWPTQKKPKKRI